MNGRLVLLLACAAVVGGCARPPAFATYTSARQKFSLAFPRGWEVVAATDEDRVWIVPPDQAAAPERAAEFLFVLTREEPGPLGDDQARQVGLNLLPIHGVSGFRRFKEEAGATWHRFEVTGMSQGAEWASVGLLVTGRRAFQYVVCAKPLQRWRDGQKQCDELLKTFRPGPLSP